MLQRVYSFFFFGPLNLTLRKWKMISERIKLVWEKELCVRTISSFSGFLLLHGDNVVGTVVSEGHWCGLLVVSDEWSSSSSYFLNAKLPNKVCLPSLCLYDPPYNFFFHFTPYWEKKCFSLNCVSLSIDNAGMKVKDQSMTITPSSFRASQTENTQL